MAQHKSAPGPATEPLPQTREELLALHRETRRRRNAAPHGSPEHVAAIDLLGVDRRKVFINLDKYGNTSAASIPIALDEAVGQGRVQPGDLLLMSGFGAGLTWGTGLLRW